MLVREKKKQEKKKRFYNVKCFRFKAHEQQIWHFLKIEITFIWWVLLTKYRYMEIEYRKQHLVYFNVIRYAFANSIKKLDIFKHVHAAG